MAQPLPEYEILLSIPGRAETTATSIIGELGDIRRFHSANQINAFIGIDLRHYESGDFLAKEHITKRGNPYARKILHYHNQKLSPEMMVKAKGLTVGMSTIYYWIHHGKLGLTKQNLLYPRKGKTVKKQASPNFKPAGQSIEQRPKAINLCLENGHYEIDTVLLTRAKNHCLLVLTDRRSRHQIIRLIPNKSAESVNRALKLILRQHHILSITADNGVEFHRLSDVFSKKHIYYAPPYASWERGINENHNRLIRRWLSKGTKKTTPKKVAFIENWINNYPKKCLDYKSPRKDCLLANLKFSDSVLARKDR